MPTSPPATAGCGRFTPGAYGWPAPSAPQVARTAAGTMRQHVKGWITWWDMLRLEGAVAQIVAGTLGMDYSETDAMTRPAEPDDEAG